jgi:hypothetical protein
MAHVAAVPPMGAVCIFRSGVLGMCPFEEWSVVGAAGRAELCACFITLQVACGGAILCSRRVLTESFDTLPLVKEHKT